MTKLWEVIYETSTDRFPHFQCLTLQCDTSTLSLRPGGRVGSPRLTSEVSLGVGGGGCFPGKYDTGFPGLASEFRPDPTRPDLDLGAQFSYHIPRPTPLRPDLTLESGDAPFWALSYYLKDL